MHPVIPPKISKYFFKIYGKIMHVTSRNSKEGAEQQVRTVVKRHSPKYPVERKKTFLSLDIFTILISKFLME